MCDAELLSGCCCYVGFVGEFLNKSLVADEPAFGALLNITRVNHKYLKYFKKIYNGL